MSRGLLKRLKGTAIPFRRVRWKRGDKFPYSRTNYEDGPETSLLGRCNVVVTLRKIAFLDDRPIDRQISFNLSVFDDFSRYVKGYLNARKDWPSPMKSISQGLHRAIILLNSCFVAIVRGGLLVPAKKRNFLFRPEMVRMKLIIATI